MGKAAKKLNKAFNKAFHKVIPKQAVRKVVGNSTIEKLLPQQALDKLTVGGRSGLSLLPLLPGVLPSPLLGTTPANSVTAPTGAAIDAARATAGIQEAQVVGQKARPTLKGFSAPENVPIDPVTQSASYQALLARARRVVKSNNPATLEGPLAEALSAQRRREQNDQTDTNFQNRRRQTLAAMIGKSLLGGAS